MLKRLKEDESRGWTAAGSGHTTALLMQRGLALHMCACNKVVRRSRHCVKKSDADMLKQGVVTGMESP